jgi:hypothetical protein
MKRRTSTVQITTLATSDVRNADSEEPFCCSALHVVLNALFLSHVAFDAIDTLSQTCQEARPPPIPFKLKYL